MPRLKAKRCANCNTKVPRAEWPQDARFPVLCTKCLHTYGAA